MFSLNVHINADDWARSFGITERELDVLACLMSNTSSKKISSILEIKHKTVETHIFNIMQKLDKHSRISVVDFVKQAPVHHHLLERNHHLTMNFDFKEMLLKIKQRVPCEGVSCKIDCQDDHVKTKIEKDLKFLKVFCFERKKNLKTITVQIQETYPLTFFGTLKEILSHPLIEEAYLRFQNSKVHEKNVNVVAHIIHNHPLQPLSNKRFLLLIGGGVVLSGGAGLITYKLYPSATPIIRSDFMASMDAKIIKRETLINRIEEMCLNHTGIRVIALVGISGSGKTMLAQHYAITQNLPIIWFVHAQNSVSLIQSYFHLAYDLSKTKEERVELEYIKNINDEKDRSAKIIFYLKNKLKASEKEWLLIFDNVDHLEMIEEFLPKDEQTWGNGQVIITTKNNQIARHNYLEESHVIDLPELTDEEKINLFEKIQEKPSSNKEALKNFLRHIPSFPLDIFTAAYYIKNTNNSYDEYLTILKNNQISYVKDIGYNGKLRHEIIFSSLDQILDQHHDFYPFLLFLSLLNNHDISIDFLKSISDIKNIDIFLTKLSEFSLIKRECQGTLSIHQSTQESMMTYLLHKCPKEDIHHFLTLFINTIKTLTECAIEKNDQNLIYTLALHIIHALHHPVIDGSSKVHLEIQLGKLYFCLGDFKNAHLFLERNLLGFEMSHDFDHALGSIYLGATYDELSNHKMAEKFLEKAVHFFDNSDESQKLYLAKALCYLGKTYSQIGMREKSKTVLQKSLNLYQNDKTSNNIDKIRTQTLLAETYMYGGDFKQAEHLFKDNEQSYTQISQNHPQLLWNSLRLGRLYMFLGQPLSAQKIFEKGIKDLRKFFKNDQAKLGWHYAYLGDIYRVMGFLEKAENNLMNGFKIYTTLYDETHPMIAWYKGYLGCFYNESEEYEKAKKNLEESLKISQTVYEKNPTRYAPVVHSLAYTYTQLGFFEQAESFYQKALSIYEEQYGKESIQYALVLKDFGFFHLKTTSFDQAEHYLKESLQSLTKADHCEVYKCLEYLGDLYVLKGNYKEAKKSYLQAIRLARKTFHKKSIHFKRLNDKLWKNCSVWEYLIYIIKE